METEPREPSEYLFTPQERAFFARCAQQAATLQAVVQSSIGLVLEQQQLSGQWRMKADASGLEQLPTEPGSLTKAVPISRRDA